MASPRLPAWRGWSHRPHTVKLQQAGQDVCCGHASSFMGVTGARGDESNQRAKLPQLQGNLSEGREASRVTPSVPSCTPGAAQGQGCGWPERGTSVLKTPPRLGWGRMLPSVCCPSICLPDPTVPGG